MCGCSLAEIVGSNHAGGHVYVSVLNVVWCSDGGLKMDRSLVHDSPIVCVCVYVCVCARACLRALCASFTAIKCNNYTLRPEWVSRSGWAKKCFKYQPFPLTITSLSKKYVRAVLIVMFNKRLI